MQKIPYVGFKITNWSDNWFNLRWLEYITDANLCSGPELSSVPSESPAAQILCSRKLLTAWVQEDSCCQHLLSSCFSNWAVCWEWPSVLQKHKHLPPAQSGGKKKKIIKGRKKETKREGRQKTMHILMGIFYLFIFFSVNKFLTTATGLNLYSGIVRLSRYL